MAKTRTKLPIGIENFTEFRSDDFYYVDKTMFIAELLQNRGKVNLFTRPRRFGKTLTMSMLKYFFEVGGREGLFDGLKISQEKELCAEYMGRFPVISVTLKSVDGLRFETAYAALQLLIWNEVRRFDFLKESSKLNLEEKERYCSLLALKDGMPTMTDALLMDSLRILSELLAKHYGSEVILLIDEYDVPLDKAFHGGYYDEMASLIRGLLSNALKTNSALYFAVLTGCLRISKESIFTGMNNLKVHTVSDVRFDEYFGFTDADVDELLRFYGLSSHKGVIKDWYDGYRFGRVSVYCPWDVINYCDVLLADPEAEPENFWANTSGNDLIRHLLKKADPTTRDEIERLINGESIVRPIRQELTYREIDDTVENIWSVLYFTGYLTQVKCLPGRQMELALPNREVEDLFVDFVKDWLQAEARADSDRINRFCQAFPAGDVAVVQEMLQDYLWDFISVRDTAVRAAWKENFYHGLMLGLLRSQGRWLLRSNAEAGKGYSDIFVCTPERIGIVIELKYAHDGSLEAACAEALRQIEEKRYMDGLPRGRVQKIVKYGMAFCGKECLVAMA